MWWPESPPQFASGCPREMLILGKGRDGSATCVFLGNGRGGSGILHDGEPWDRLRVKWHPGEVLHKDTQIPNRLMRFGQAMFVLPGQAAFPSIPLVAEGAEHLFFPRMMESEGVQVHKARPDALGSAVPASPSIIPACRHHAISRAHFVAAEKNCIPPLLLTFSLPGRSVFQLRVYCFSHLS